MGELKATCSTTLEVLQCSKTTTSYDRSQCVLLALSVCALGGARRKGAGFGSTKGCPPPPPTTSKQSHTPWGHTLAGGGPRAPRPPRLALFWYKVVVCRVQTVQCGVHCAGC